MPTTALAVCSADARLQDDVHITIDSAVQRPPRGQTKQLIVRLVAIGIEQRTRVARPFNAGVQVSRYAAGADHHHRVILLKCKSYYR